MDNVRNWTQRKSIIVKAFVVWRTHKAALLDRKTTRLLRIIGPLLVGLLLSAGMASAEVNRFPEEPPIVLSHTPDMDAVQVPVDVVISVVWDRPMQPDTNFNVTGPDGIVSGLFRYYHDTNTITFLPDADLAPETRYTVLIVSQVALNGQMQQQTYQWTFETVTPTSVSIVSIGSANEDPGQSWWWSSWPWLMATISLLSLAGFLLIWSRRHWSVPTK